MKKCYKPWVNKSAHWQLEKVNKFLQLFSKTDFGAVNCCFFVLLFSHCHLTSPDKEILSCFAHCHLTIPDLKPLSFSSGFVQKVKRYCFSDVFV